MMLIAFDFDGTLVAPFSAEALPGVREALRRIPRDYKSCVITNQTEPAYRMVTGDNKYPSVGNVVDRFAAVLSVWRHDWRPDLLLICCASGREGEQWEAADVRVADLMRRALSGAVVGTDYEVLADPRYRKPAPGMLQLARTRLRERDMIFIGDMKSDEQAAEAAGARFMDAALWRRGVLL